MVISHKYKYVFIQLDRTASTTIAKELVEYYDGKHILWKHARYCDFLKIANEEEEKYFAFSGMRNPLDVIVTEYFRTKIDMFGRFSNINKRRGVSKLNIKKHNYISNNNADFTSFYKKFYYTQIYNEWKTKDFEKLDFIYCFEDLQRQFSNILRKLRIKQKRPLPVVNKTPERKNDFTSYYTKEIQSRAKIVLGKYMIKWGYTFPINWNNPSLLKRVYFGIPLNIKYQMKRVFHQLIDTPYIYQNIYKNHIQENAKK